MSVLVSLAQVWPTIGAVLMPDEQAVMMWGLAVGGAFGALLERRMREARAKVQRTRRPRPRTHNPQSPED